MRRIRLGSLLLVIALAASACSQSSLTLREDAVGGGLGPSDQRGPEPSSADPDDVVAAALDDLADYWAEAYPLVYGDRFEPLRGGLVPYGPDTVVPECGPDPIGYEEIEANALYCPDEDLIAWDRVNLIPDLDERFGPLTVGIVMAHEYAHAIQSRGEVDGATVTLELQADCFAGAWVADVADRIDLFSTEGDSLDQAIAGFLELRDTVGVGATDPQAHGSGFDRVSAFQDGFDIGNDTCAGYEDLPPTVVAVPFTSLDDLNQEGNLPVDQLLEPLLADLESFYTALLADEGIEWSPVAGVVPVDPRTDTVDCGDQRIAGAELELASFYCLPDETIYIDAVELIPALSDIGDFAVGGEIARQYAFAAQVQLGILDRVADTSLHADCLTGVYAGAEFDLSIPDQELVLSPGDLDEIIIAFLAFGGEATATAFERTVAFRIGFLDGFERCEPFLS